MLKKIILLAVGITVSCAALADEGMWLLPYLQKMNIATMKKEGCRLSAEQIYSAKGQKDLQDAVVIFGRGCTGEVVSAEGLVLTNHHCGYGSIQQLSSVEKDYLKNGYWASRKSEEIPVPGLEIRFIKEIKEVTTEVLGNIPSTARGEERTKMADKNSRALQKEIAAQSAGFDVKVVPFFGGNQYFMFKMQTFKDIRFVGAPPTSIGKFGGETDNWMWPRHTGDFSVFRIYASKNNEPAEYAADNVPYKPENHLSVSLKGYKEGDFAMIMGFPGRTQRYMTSYEIDKMLNVDNPQRIFIRGERQQILWKAMLASDEVRIKYAAKYASSSNYWKNSIGKSRGIQQLGVRDQKVAQEQAFQAWADKNTLPEEGFQTALQQIKKSIEMNNEADAARQYLSEAMFRSVEIMSAASSRNQEELTDFYKDYDAQVDRAVAKRMFAITKQNCKRLPNIFKEIDEKFGGSTDAYVDWLYDNSVYVTLQGAQKALADKDVRANDPAVQLYQSVFTTYRAQAIQMRAGNALYDEGHRLYIAGLMRQYPNKAWYPDANSTIRLTYGRVLPYVPKDGVYYDYRTTLAGVIEKEDASKPAEFSVPEKLKQLYAAQDYGRYADSDGKLPVAFLANCDITGGNSGSPIMNGKGELLGLAFDGNWEAMSGDEAFAPELQRTISVDIRYVLFIIDKFAGAGWIVDEMTLK